jgi:septal ring factor EnvC (AmiA/AmiB activator)
MEADLAVLEHKLALLITRVAALREANASLERDLAQARARNRELSQRIEAASIRLDALLERLPEGSR